MSIINLLTDAKRNFESQSAAQTLATTFLHQTEQSIRLIDPQLLGEKRYDASAHWEITQKVYDFCYFIKNLWHRDSISLLKGNLERAKRNITATGDAVEESKKMVDGLTQLLTNRIAQLSAQKREQEEALAALEKPSSPDIKPSGFTQKCRALMSSYWNAPSQSQEHEARLAQEKQTLRSRIEATDKELQPLIDYTKEAGAPAPMEVKPTIGFDQLTIEDSQKALMMETIPVVAHGTILDLIPKIPKFLQAKETLGPLHPLKSLEEILTNPSLRDSLIAISKNSTKWKGKWIFGYGQVDGFLQSTSKRLEKYHAQGEIIPFIPGFAKALGLTADQEAKLMQFASNQNWEGFITEIADIAAKKS